MSWMIVPVLEAVRGPRPAAVPPRPEVPILHLTQTDRVSPTGRCVIDLAPFICASAYVRGYLDQHRGVSNA